MDDQKFDDGIKSKIGEYEAPGFEPAALASLHYQMGSLTTWSWYAQYRTELFVSGLAISTMVIVWSLWLLNRQAEETMNEKIDALENQLSTIARGSQNNALKNIQRDTVRIIEIRMQPSPSNFQSLLYRVELLELENKNLRSRLDGHEKELALSEAFIEQEEDKSKGSISFPTRVSPGTEQHKSMRAQPTELSLTHTVNKDLPASTLRNLEKHYQKGIGIRIGPVVEFSKGKYEVGESDLAVSYGLLGDFILSPSLSVETGFKYAKKYYEVEGTDRLSNTDYPGADESLGTLVKAEIDSWMMEIPITLKYRYPFSLKSHIIVGSGYSAFLYAKQIFEYDYSFTGGGESFTIGSTYEKKQTTFYPGSVNFMIGISNQLKNKKTLETSVFYQLGIGEKGIEKTNFNCFGIRGVYWFTVR